VILTGPRPRYYDYATRKWVTAPETQTYPLLTVDRPVAGGLGLTSVPVVL
jgi:hypothetical protein